MKTNVSERFETLSIEQQRMVLGVLGARATELAEDLERFKSDVSYAVYMEMARQEAMIQEIYKVLSGE